MNGVYRILNYVRSIGRKCGRRRNRSREYLPGHNRLKITGEASSDNTKNSREIEKAARQQAFGHDAAVLIPRHTRYNIGFNSILKKTQPVHETLTLAAMVLADPEKWKHASYDEADADTWELFRGVMWNDDPCCDLFEDTPERNNAFSSGVDFGAHFALGKAEAELALTLGWWPLRDLRNGPLTGRSHFYDLQFLHSMAMNAGEEAQVTRAKILLWCQTMYRLAAHDGVTADMRIQDVSAGSDGYRLELFFDDHTSVKRSDTVFRLLTNGTEYAKVKIEYRALGSLLHVIQDSYARGHTQRESSSSSGSGLAGDNSGDVTNFHCYLGQDAARHAHFDDLDVSTVSPEHLESFDAIPGARAAIRACARVIQFWQAGAPWTGEVEAFLSKTVFKCTPAVTPSNTDV